MKMRKSSSSSNRYLEWNNEKHGTKEYAISMSSKHLARYILSVCLSVRPHVALGMKRNKAWSSEIRGKGREGEKALNCGTIKYIHIDVYAHEMPVIDTYSRVWR